MGKKVSKDYHALAQKRGFKWLGPEVSNCKAKTRWGCSEGHNWESTYDNIKQGHGCPDCYNKDRGPVLRYTSADYQVLAEGRGFKWLGLEVPKNTGIKTRWECPEGHQWESRYDSIRRGYGCPHCAGLFPKVPENYTVLGMERGFAWLGPLPSNTHIKTFWECLNAHRWEASYHSIHQGRGCPKCAIRSRATKREKKPIDYHTLATQHKLKWLGPEVPNDATKTFWECSNGHRWETSYGSIRRGSDCHYCAGNIPKTPGDYVTLAEKRGFRWVGQFPKNVRTKTFWKCSKGHQWEAGYDKINQGRGCPYCAGKAPRVPTDYHNLAKRRGFEWLGPEAPTTRAKTWWMCLEGHRWEACYSNIQQGKGCPKCAIELNTARRRKKPTDYHTVAKKHGFKWLGPDPKSIHSKTWWQCSKGHKWEGIYSNIYRGEGCPNCADMVNGVQVSKPQRQLCEMMNGELNYLCGRYRIDVALVDEMIAIEYDCWFWHGHKQDYDAQRDADLIAVGWKVLHVKSNNQLPSQQQMEKAITQLISGKRKMDIVLDDWGKGKTFATYKEKQYVQTCIS